MIRQARSGQSLSVTWYTVVLASAIAFFVYGCQERSLALITLAVCRAPFSYLILVELKKFSGLAIKDKLIDLGLAIFLIWMNCSSDKDWFYLTFTFLGVACYCLQPLALWRDQSRGALSIQLIIFSAGSALFWMLYGLALDNWIVWSSSAGHVIVNLTTIALWLHYEPEIAISEGP